MHTLILALALQIPAGAKPSVIATAAGRPAVAAPSQTSAASKDAASAAQILANLQKTYRGRTFTAQFSQTYTDAILGPKPAEQGRLQAAGDGCVRFDYLEPTAKQFVYDGNSAYFYEPEAAQVTVIERFATGPLATTMGFLWGQGTLSTAFNATLCRKGCPKLGPGEVALVLTPKKAMAGVQRVVLVVQEPAHEVSRTLLTDPLRNETEYALTERRLGAAIAADVFSFVVPPGLSVLRTSPDGAMPDAGG